MIYSNYVYLFLSQSSRTALIFVSDDGSLRLQYCNNSEAVLHWLRPQYQPSTPLAYLTAQPTKKSARMKKTVLPPKFPVDFFESCVRMQDNEVEVSFLT